MQRFWEEFDRYRAFLVQDQQSTQSRSRSMELYVQEWDEEWRRMSNSGRNVREKPFVRVAFMDIAYISKRSRNSSSLTIQPKVKHEKKQQKGPQCECTKKFEAALW